MPRRSLGEKAMFRLATVAGAILCLACGMIGEAKEVPKTLRFKMKQLDGKDVALKDYQGKVLLMVNVASKCGLTPQYEQLQGLHEQYAKEGLVVMGFPCNQFRKQEPGTASEIREFCKANYGVEFPLFSKVEVNGEGACDLYKHLTSLKTEPVGEGKISWNFEKFLVGRDGEVVARFSPRTRPDAAEVIEAIETALQEK